MVPTVPGSGVRPTRRCLTADLRLPVPDLRTPLEGLPHELIMKAQRVPEQVAAGGAELIQALDDRQWFKVKTDAWRGAVTKVVNPLGPWPDRGLWWLGASGVRRADSPHQDFYESLTAACRQERRAKNAERGSALRSDASTTHMLPDEWDRDRLSAEIAERTRFEAQHLVRSAAACSLREGKAVSFSFAGMEGRVRIRSRNGHEAYIAISAAGLADAKIFVLLLGAIPGVAPGDWLPEPGGVADLNPEAGEVIWSAVIPPDSAAHLLDEFDDV